MGIYVADLLVVAVIATAIAVATRWAISKGFAFGGIIPQKYTQPTKCTCTAKLADPFCTQHQG